MENIFENAYFGKAYKTRDGSKAIFICKRTDNSVWDLTHPYACVVEGYGEIWDYYPNGRLYRIENFITESDIVSEWQEPIDEKELDKMAIDDILNVLNSDYYDGRISFKMVKEIYKAGYHKAKRE